MMSMTDSVQSTTTAEVLRQAPAQLRWALSRIKHLKRGDLTFHLPGGQVWRLKGQTPGGSATAYINDWRVFRRVLSSGDIGLADAYMAGEFETPDLTAFLLVCAQNYDSMRHLAVGDVVTRFAAMLRHRLFKKNSRAGSRKNILAHYDLGNDFYKLWLDPSMTYSSAIFAHDDQSLEDAQKQKYRRIASEAGARPGAHILEIGCGWGGFAEIAAKEFGAKVTSLTISDAQYAFARQRMADQGLDDRVEIRKQDYRDVTGQFDGVASIEMFEAVGEEYWPAYFSKIADVLKPNGAAALQIITIDNALFKTYRKRADFIQHYIFPGGMLPSVEALDEVVGSHDLQITNQYMFRQDYAETLKRWRSMFDEHWDTVEAMGFDQAFKRLWRFYLCYCEAGFSTGRIDVGQFTLKRT